MAFFSNVEETQKLKVAVQLENSSQSFIKKKNEPQDEIGRVIGREIAVSKIDMSI